MIPAIELRYKNYIQTPGGLLGYVDDHKFSPRSNEGTLFVMCTGGIHTLGITEALPVPVSPNFLMETSFRTFAKYTNEDEVHYRNEIDVEITYSKKKNKYFLKSAYPIEICKEIRSVHHLQNMWFYLFDEELYIAEAWEL